MIAARTYKVNFTLGYKINLAEIWGNLEVLIF